MKPDPRVLPEVDSRMGLPRWLLPGVAAAAILVAAGAPRDLTVHLVIGLLTLAVIWQGLRIGYLAIRGGGAVGWWIRRVATLGGLLVATLLTGWLVG